MPTKFQSLLADVRRILATSYVGDAFDGGCSVNEWIRVTVATNDMAANQAVASAADWLGRWRIG